ncbi:hypothetical protein DFJ58DRAFT_741853 [Suillus subalutaceus]|uniref:uncharacterized protein n=1 Tax=Suillus subalutaceus TaxID=48586 RepID=UPI001B87BB98|nr:uncharacterized protein DFJ58DRAFT_741853 [Suillus subalutaceus]KAG1872450.1 hypothetical protein DFJ58DRAFT_741853 [Suillus subalutaceus]
MDAFTGGVTILQLVQTIGQASFFLYRYVVSARNAPSSCKRLLDQYNSIRGILTAVMDIKKDPCLPDNLRGVLSKLMAENGPITKLHGELKQHLPDDLEKETGEIADRSKQYYVDITAILAIDSWNTIKEISQGVHGLREDSTAQKLREKAEERHKFLQWMNLVSCTEKYATCHGQRNPGIGRWIFYTDEYKTWNTSDRAFLWLNGQPGHGKTILASSVIDEIQGKGEAESQTLRYFYCNFRDDRTTSAAAVLRSLVVQLLQQSQDDWITKIREPGLQEGDITSLRNLWQQQYDAKLHPTGLGYLRKLLVEASTLVRRPVLVIDALDECKDHPNLVGHLVNLAEDARLRLFVTGRSEPDIQDALYDLPTLSLKDSAQRMKADICAHITEQLKTQTKLSCLSDALKETILDVRKGRGHVSFAGFSVNWTKSWLAKDVSKLRQPSITFQLDFTRRMMGLFRQSNKEDEAMSKSPGVLNEAMMIEVGQSNLSPDLGVMDPMDIVTACGSLVTYNENTGVVALSHYSVKEYLISRPSNIFRSISDMHAQICEFLITQQAGLTTTVEPDVDFAEDADLSKSIGVHVRIIIGGLSDPDAGKFLNAVNVVANKVPANSPLSRVPHLTFSFGRGLQGDAMQK